MSPLGLFSAQLLVYCTLVWASNDSVVLTTANQLREELRSELHEVKVCSFRPQNCSSFNEDLVAEYVMDSVKEVFNRSFEDLLSRFSKMFIPGYSPNRSASSCKEILQLAPQSPSSFYWIRGTDNEPKHVYCDMERSCKGVAGGWMRVASINMTNTSHSCPSGLRTLTNPRRLCAMNIDGAGCSSTVLPIQGIAYSQVCGKIIGYQQKTPDAFRGRSSGTVDSNYVDGISLTHGSNPRKHIWTFAAALHEHYSHLTGICPCINVSITPPPPVPDFLGNDYFCDTASKDFHRYIFYGDDPLWDGAGCSEFNTCCSWNCPPWFRKVMYPPTSDNIEMRLCANENRGNEDITFETLQIYVQ